jgi:hypothetical protein
MNHATRYVRLLLHCCNTIVSAGTKSRNTDAVNNLLICIENLIQFIEQAQSESLSARAGSEREIWTTFAPRFCKRGVKTEINHSHSFRLIHDINIILSAGKARSES